MTPSLAVLQIRICKKKKLPFLVALAKLYRTPQNGYNRFLQVFH